MWCGALLCPEPVWSSCLHGREPELGGGWGVAPMGGGEAGSEQGRLPGVGGWGLLRLELDQCVLTRGVNAQTRGQERYRSWPLWLAGRAGD